MALAWIAPVVEGTEDSHEQVPQLLAVLVRLTRDQWVPCPRYLRGGRLMRLAPDHRLDSAQVDLLTFLQAPMDFPRILSN